MLAVPMGLLKDGLPNSPRMRSRYSWSEEVGHEGDWVLRPKSTDAESRIHILFGAIERGRQTWYKTVPGLVEEVQYMLETDFEASQYLDDWLLNQYADLALLCELGKSINLLAPWFDHTTAELLILDNIYERKREKVEISATKLRDGIYNATGTNLGWNPLDKAGKAHEYPSEKHKSKVNVEKMRDAEKRLDLLWKRLEKAVEIDQAISLKKVLKRRSLDKNPRILYRTPPWKEEASVSPLLETGNSSTVLGETDGNVPRSGKAFLTDLAEKVKTRGVAAGAYHHPATGRAEDAPPPEPEVAPPKFKLGKKAYKIWLTLLPSVESAQHPRPELGWDELLSGMRAIGLEPEKLYGSVWSFSPVKDRTLFPINRSIQFHEPKEVRKGGKIPKPMVRTFGRRLRHAFGWESAEAMFELEQ
ncbi:uncharacterized protein RCC_10271 [Ramularia collo-cygni]|uniref:Uncharacterized protein n=1 Tax=Ramularia collo-cygni TaxID=112498 RepID=A0A2D3V5B2_9PEZI|nr:uncharacterized protein RCC_10271 [Ramularia collo-cygni]CZT24546.1 uncharacterized protein RCC_10271 [Ramularia collo-cygni]